MTSDRRATERPQSTTRRPRTMPPCGTCGAAAHGPLTWPNGHKPHEYVPATARPAVAVTEVALPAREQTIETAAQALHDDAVPGCVLAAGVCPVMRHYRREAAVVLAVLPAAAVPETTVVQWGARLKPSGKHERVENCRTGKRRAQSIVDIYRDRPSIDACLVRRTITTYADGSFLTSAWELADGDEGEEQHDADRQQRPARRAGTTSKVSTP